MCRMDVRFTGDGADMVTWIASAPGFMQRASHALVVDGATWLIDPVDHPDVRARLADLPPPAGVVQLLDRHGRDCARMATAFGVPLTRTPRHSVAGAPFTAITVRDAPGWRESALWWPDRSVLVVAEALGTAPYFRARPADVLGPHPAARVWPPRRLTGFPARHVLVGHGEPLNRDDAGALVDAAVAQARRGAPAWMVSLLTGSVRRGDRRSPIVTRG